MFKWDTLPRPKRLAFCLVCGECLGKDRPQYEKEHKEKFPSHIKFVVMPMIDPLVLDDPDAWFRRKRYNRRLSNFSNFQFREDPYFRSR